VPWSGVKACTKQTLEKCPLSSISSKTPEEHMKHTQSHADVLAGRVKAISKCFQLNLKASVKHFQSILKAPRDVLKEYLL